MTHTFIPFLVLVFIHTLLPFNVFDFVGHSNCNFSIMAINFVFLLTSANYVILVRVKFVQTVTLDLLLNVIVCVLDLLNNQLIINY